VTQPVPEDVETIAHFRVEERIGEGGMGVVYRAEDEKLRRTVALKVLPRGDDSSEERRARFLREARAAAAVTHPNIATIYEVGEDDGRVYIAMEYVRGQTLRALLAKGPPPIREALRIARGVARGMARAHERGIVHRDLKPDNVMLDEESEVKVLDFGLAKRRVGEGFASHATETGRMLGTPAYMAPEQWEARPVDARSDVFSFGVMLYELVTGKRPFDRPIALLRDDAAPPSAIAAGVPPAVDRIIATCLEKDAAKRYPDAGAIVQALDAVTANSASSRRAAPRRKRGRLPIAVPVGAAALVAAVGMSVLLGRRAAQPSASRGATPSATLGSPALAGVAITEHPAPKSDSAAALAAYAAGLQSMRDGAMGEGNTRFQEALKLDPSFAAAHLRLALYDSQTPTELRNLFGRAASLRAKLDDRDGALLELAQTAASDPAALAERIRAVESAYPRDAEVAFVSGAFALVTNHFETARESLARAIPLDPKFALPLLRQADLDLVLGEPEEARATLERCLQVSPIASTCMHIRAAIGSGMGRCAEFEAESRRMLLVEPTSGVAQVYLAAALAANGASADTVRGALEQAIDLGEGASSGAEQAKRVARAWVDAELALYGADFDAARARIDVVEQLQATDSGEQGHAQAARSRLLLDEETGDATRARADATAYIDRVPTLLPDGAAIARPVALAVLRRNSAITRERNALLYHDGWTATVPAGVERTPGDDALAWVSFEAEPARNEAEARYALAARPAGKLGAFLAPFLWDLDQEGFIDRALGNAYLLASRTDEALPALQRGASACDVLHAPIEQMRAHVQLGAALESRGDVPGACAAYRYVVDRWPAPKPRSVSVQTARGRLAALGCR
jgi:serine/threonine-protein kinase